MCLLTGNLFQRIQQLVLKTTKNVPKVATDFYSAQVPGWLQIITFKEKTLVSGFPAEMWPRGEGHFLGHRG